MRRQSMRLLKKATLALAIVSLFAAPAVAQQGTGKQIQRIERNKADNTPQSITFKDGVLWSPERADAIFKEYLGLDGVTNKMVLKNVTTTNEKVTTSRYAQYYNGVPVQYGDVVVISKNGMARYITSNIYHPATAVTTTPALTATAALDKAKEFVHAEKYMWEIPGSEKHLKLIHQKDSSYYPTGQLVWIEDMMEATGSKQLHLAWSFNIYAQKPVSRQIVFVDAQTGKILYSNNEIKHTAATNRTKYSGTVNFATALIGGTYYLYDSTRGGGVYTVSADYGTNLAASIDIVSPTNNWPVVTADTQALDAHWGAEKVYDYFISAHARNSWDGSGGILMQFVHVDTSFNNAYWDGAEMCYGDGTGVAAGGFDPLTSLDVTAHEIGHGVCQATANLAYNRESGAMNEALSDCWAATIEHYADPFETDAIAKRYWKIGEEIGGGNPLRSMDNPLLQGDPATYGGTYWNNVTACTPTSGNDQCYVHTNSGVLNHWYYFVVTGGVGVNDLGTAYNVNAIGWTDAARILYLTELSLISSSNYAACRTASINAATTIFGACSPQVQCVTNAWYAVGVGAAFAPCTPQIGFVGSLLNASENASSTSCPSTRNYNIGLKAVGTPITGGSPVVSLGVARGTAVAGVDYTFTPSSVTFGLADTTTHYVTLTVYDNGAVRDNKNIVFDFTLAPMGSTTTIQPGGDTFTVNILNNDSIPLTGGIEYHTLDTNAALTLTSTTCNLTSCFPGANRRQHTQYLILANEMVVAGVKPNVPISQIAFNVVSKSSTAAFIGYTISMGNTTAGNLGSAYAGGTTQVYTGNHTTNMGLDSINFNTANFVWDGTSNVAVDICYGRNAAAFGANDQVKGVVNASTSITNRNGNNTGTGTGCTLAWSGAGVGTARPVMRFKQDVPPATIETAAGSTRTWTVKAGTEVYFRTPTADTNVIAGLNNESANLGCVTATVSQAGVGFTPATFAAINRSRKEVTITPTTGATTTSYDVNFYMTNTELNSVAPATLYLLRTTSATDAGITGANTTIVTPTLITGTNYVGFKGTFTGFGRYFLTDGPLCSTPTTTVTVTGATTFCTGGSVTLTAAGGTGYTYQWQLAGAPISGATNATYVATGTGSYDVVVTQGSCSATSTATAVTALTVSAAPITGSGTVCLGGTATLTDATAGGTWSSSSTGVASITATGLVYGVSLGSATISYAVTNACGTAVVTSSISVVAPPTVAAITGTATACPGSSSTLSNATTGGTWSSSNTARATVSTTGVVTGVSSGSVTISYSVTNATGCTTSAVTTYNVLATPSAAVSASGPTTFCLGGNVTISVPTAAGVTYQWLSGGTPLTGATNASYTATTSGNYSVQVGNGTCTQTSSVVTVTATTATVVVPAVSITATPGFTLCTGMTSASFAAVPVNGGTTPTYNWYVNGIAAGTASTMSYSPAAGDIVKVVMRSSATCAFPDTAAGTGTMSFSPYVNPAVGISAVPGDTVCEGSVITLLAAPTYGGSTPTYRWTRNGANVATGPAYSYPPANGDVIKVYMRSNFLCRLIDSAESAPTTIVVDSNIANTITVTASQSSIRPGQSVTFTASAPHGGSSPVYQWYLNGSAITGATSNTYTTTTLVAGDIVTCKVTSSEPCASPATATSGGVSILVTSGIGTNGSGNTLIVVPNPNGGIFSIKGTIAAGNDGAATIRITNMLGQTIYQNAATTTNGQIDQLISLDGTVAAGVYQVNVITGSGSTVFQVVIEK